MTSAVESRHPVLVTGIGGGGHGEQILKALKLADRYFIVGADAIGECANRHEVAHFSLLPRAHDPRYLGELVALAERFSCRAIFHGSEAEMMVLSHERERLAERGFYVPVNPPSVMRICQDKSATMAFLAAQGARVPAFREVRSLADCSDFRDFPAVIKPSRGGGGSANVFIVQNSEELTNAIVRLSENPDECLIRGARACEVWKHNSGALKIIMPALEPYLRGDAEPERELAATA